MSGSGFVDGNPDGAYELWLKMIAVGGVPHAVDADLATTDNFLIPVKRYNSMRPAQAANCGVIIHGLVRQIFSVP